MVSVQDDRGDPIRLAPLRRVIAPGSAAAPVRATLRRRVILPLAIGAGALLALVAGALLFVLVLAIATGARIFGLIFHTPAQASGIGMIILVAGLARLIAGAHAARLERVALRLGRCPGCLYDLAGVPSEDALVVCPECAAAWRAARVAAQGHEPPRVVMLQRSEPAATTPAHTTAAIGAHPIE